MKNTWIYFLFFSVMVHAQQTYTGVVRDEKNRQGLEDVVVLHKESRKWAVTDSQGYFSIQVPNGKHINLSFQLLGKEEKTVSLHSDDANTLEVYLADKDLRMDEVVVSVQKGNDYSEIVLGEEAINQVQSFSVNEVLEQLPGQAITDLNLHGFKPIVFRSVRPPNVADEGFGNKSFGTAILLDDIPIPNNGNMQSYFGASSNPFSPNFLGFGDNRSGSGFNSYFPNANFGADLRQLSTVNIEKIEVVQGIPSAKYGDLTSGLVKIDQKAGEAPFRTYGSFRNGTAEYGISKGFSLGSKAGFLNASLSYLKSNANQRVSFTHYKRINSQLMWSWANTDKSIRNTFSVRYGFNDDDVNYEEEDLDQKRVKNEQKDLTLSNRFKWIFEDSFFDHLDVNASFSYSEQFSYDSRYINSGGRVVGFSRDEGVYEGIYTAPVYTSIKAVEGIPISVFAAADVYKSINLSEWTHNFSGGFSYRMSDNKGRGRLGSPENMSVPLTGSSSAGSGKSSFRPYNFADNVKAESQFSAYIEDHFYTYWGENKLDVTAGLRVDHQNEYLTFSPRINTYFIHKDLKIRGGFGLTSKAPSLNQIYTGFRYYDVVLGDFRVPGEYNIGVIQTFREREDNPNIKPSRSLRTELGIDYKFAFGTLNLTGFYNRLFDGVTSSRYVIQRDLARVSINDDDMSNPQIIIDGYEPYYYTQSILTNGLTSEDIGLEFFMNIPNVINNVDLDLQGSYTQTQNANESNGAGGRLVASSDASQPERYGVYEGDVTTRSRLKLGGNLTYHIPKIGLIVAMRSEHFIFTKNKTEHARYPYAYINENLEQVSIPEADRQNNNLYGHIIRDEETDFIDNDNKVFHNFHLRVSKDFLNGFRFSVYANNFLDLKPTSLEIINGSQRRVVNPDVVQLSFGAKIEYQF